MKRQSYNSDTLDGDSSESNNIGKALVWVDPNGPLYGSALGDGWHAPIFDLDMPHILVPSKTEGHSHLYVNKKVKHDDLYAVLCALRDAGLTGEGNVVQFEEHGMMFARKPIF